MIALLCAIVWTLILTANVESHAGRAHHYDEMEHVCMHDDHFHRTSTSFTGKDPATPQHYDNPHRLASPTGSSLYPQGYSPIRFSVLASDVYDPTRTCQFIGHHTMDMSGSIVTCSTPDDIMTLGKSRSLVDFAVPIALSRIRQQLLVQPVVGNLSVVAGACPYYTVPSEVAQYGVPNADIVVLLSCAKTSGSVIAWAGYCGVDQYDRPTLSRLNVGSQHLPEHWENATTMVKEKLIRVLMHEVVHALGFSIDYFTSYYPRSTTSINFAAVIRGKQNATGATISTPRLSKVASEYFACDNVSFVELEDEGPIGTAQSHFERRNLYQELMVGVTSASSDTMNRLSAMTLALLEDSGHYRAVDLNAAERMTWGSDAGCVFLQAPCLLVASNSSAVVVRAQPNEPWFCADPSGSREGNSFIRASDDALGGATLASDDNDHSYCTFEYSSVGSCAVTDIDSIPPGGVTTVPLSERYLAPRNLTGNVSLTDRCPIVVRWADRICNEVGTTGQRSGAASLDGIAFMEYRGHADARCVEAAITTVTVTTTQGGDINKSSTNTSSRFRRAVCSQLRCVNGVLVQVLFSFASPRDVVLSSGWLDCPSAGGVISTVVGHSEGATDNVTTKKVHTVWARCPRASHVCGSGELNWQNQSVRVNDSSVPPQQSTATSAPASPTTAPSTTLFTTRSPVTLAPPTSVPPRAPASTTTASPPATITAPPRRELSFLIRLGGNSWDRVIGNQSLRRSLNTTVTNWISKSLTNRSSVVQWDQLVRLRSFAIGSLVVNVSLMALTSNNSNTAIDADNARSDLESALQRSAAESSAEFGALRSLYQSYSQSADEVKFDSCVAASAPAISPQPVAALAKLPFDCTTEAYCVAVIVIGVIGVVGAAGFLVIRAICRSIDDKVSAADTDGQATEIGNGGVIPPNGTLHESRGPHQPPGVCAGAPKLDEADERGGDNFRDTTNEAMSPMWLSGRRHGDSTYSNSTGAASPNRSISNLGWATK